MLWPVWVDRVRIAFATLVPHIEEGYIPAQHNSGWVTTIANWQAQCHDLAANGVRLAKRASYPFPQELSGLALLYHDGRLVVHLGHTLDALQRSALMPTLGGMHSIANDMLACKVWAAQVASCRLGASALRCIFWLRSACSMFQTMSATLRCPYCRQACIGWGVHGLHACAVLAAGALFVFHHAIDHLRRLDFAPCMIDTVTVSCSTPVPWSFRLCHDGDMAVPDTAVGMTWSGLIRAGPALQRALSYDLCSTLSRVYLQAMGKWAEAESVL